MKSISLLTYERRKLEFISTFINREIEDDYYKKNHHPYSLLICKKINAMHKLHCFINIKTLLRFSDLLQLKINEIVNEKSFNIIQNKTGRKIVKPFEIINNELRGFLLSYRELPDYISYESYRGAIKRVVRKYLNHLSVGYNHDTHIFRHLDASFLASIGKSYHDISIHLGHMDKRTTAIYIHEELKEKSINHN